MAYTKYSLTPANNTAAPPDGAPEGMLPSAVNDTMRDMMAQIRDCGDGIRDGTYTMTAPKITGGTITGSTINNSAIGGTTATTGKFTTLEATGVATFSAGAVGTPAITTTGDTNTGIFFPAADTIAFTEGGAESMRIDSSGNVGIGTATPSTYGKFVTYSSGGYAAINTDGQILSYQLLDVATAGGRLTGGSNQGVLGEVAIEQTTTGAKGGYVRFNTCASGSNTPTERMRIDSSGNVGIGTTAPAIKLEISGNGELLRFDGSANQDRSMYFRNVGTSNTAKIVTDGIMTLGSNAVASVTFITQDAERMRIPSGGGLLVGSTSDSLTANGFRITSSTGQFGGITMTGGAGDGPQWQMINLTDAGTVPNGFRWLSFRIGSGATEVGKIEKASSTSVAYTTTSDYRLKENVEPLTNALARVAALKPVKWKWKNQNDGGEGFIAHELSEVCPLAVTGKKDAYEKDGVTPRYQGVDTSFLVATLTAAIQELKAELDSVKAELQTLKGN